MKGSVSKILVISLLFIFLPRTLTAKGDSISLVMFWNVENYFDPFDDEEIDDQEYVYGGEKWWSWKRFCKKRNGIAKTVVSTKNEYGVFPSIIGLAEVENRMVLNQLVYNTSLSKLNYGIVHRDSPDRRGIDVAMLYRRDEFLPSEIRALFVPLPDTTKRTRDILYVKGYSRVVRDSLHIFINHWPSKWGGAKATEPKRMAAARVLGRSIDSLLSYDNKTKIIIMGDFNDNPASNSIRYLEGGGVENLGKEIFVQGHGTIRWRAEWDLIDMFLVANMTNSEMLIYSPDFLREREDTYLGFKPFRTYRGPVYLGGYSDHFPILLRIRLID